MLIGDWTADGLSSVRPFQIRAWHEWCGEQGYTPYLLVAVDERVQVPTEFVQNGQIVLNVGVEATGHLSLGDEFIQFKARFSGAVRDIIVPVGHVLAIYARETGQGMAFPPPELDVEDDVEVDDEPPPPPRSGLRIVK